MKLLAVSGNPRKEGFTQSITDLVVQGAREAGAEVDSVDLLEEKINVCVGCYTCWTKSAGVCIHNDSMPDLLEKIVGSDILLCSTPLYNYTMSSVMKIFLERTFPLFKPGIEKNKEGLFRNHLRYPDKWKDKKLAFITVGALKSVKNFDGLLSSFRLLADGMHMKFAGGLVRPESHLLPFSIAKPRIFKIIESALVKCGSDLATKGMFSEENIKNAATSLSTDDEHFKRYSDIYWEYVSGQKVTGQKLKEIQKAIARDVRILMQEMARSMDPLATASMKATLQFNFPDKNYLYCLCIDKGSCTLEERESASFDLKVTVNSEVWAGIFNRELSAKDALMNREILVEGDKMLFTRLERYFPPPAD